MGLSAASVVAAVPSANIWVYRSHLHRSWRRSGVSGTQHFKCHQNTPPLHCAFQPLSRWPRASFLLWPGGGFRTKASPGLQAQRLETHWGAPGQKLCWGGPAPSSRPSSLSLLLDFFLLPKPTFSQRPTYLSPARLCPSHHLQAWSPTVGGRWE